MRLSKGFSLIELCVCLLVLAIMLCVAVPSWQQFVCRQTMLSDINSLVNLINYAKVAAIEQHTRVTLCRSQDHIYCDLHWQGDFMVFLDAKRQGIVASPEHLLRVWQDSAQAEIRWHPSQRFINLHPSGVSRGVAGSFYYCPHQHKKALARALVINMLGRIRIVPFKDMPASACD